ncbi:MAG: hypothetical protein LUH82_02595, partial [Clostridiales bacterium]|nr:hypothetical protein [Clostridiales bacterium]
MKKLFKKATSMFLAVLMAATSLFAVDVSALALSSDYTQYADELLDAIEAYEAKMDGTLYTNMSAAYEAYVTACKYYDQYYYGSSGNRTTAQSYATALKTATAAMSAITSDDLLNNITYTTSAADGTYSSDSSTSYKLLAPYTANAAGTIYDTLSGVIYTYGVSSNAGFMGWTSAIDSLRGGYNGTRYGSVVILYTGANTQTITDGQGTERTVSGYSFPINISVSKNTTLSSTSRRVRIYGFESPVSGYSLNDNAFSTYNYWHGYSNSAIYQYNGYSSGDSTYSIGYYFGGNRAASSFSTGSDNTSLANYYENACVGQNSASYYYWSGTLYYTATPSSTYTLYDGLDFYTQSTGSGYYMVTKQDSNGGSTTTTYYSTSIATAFSNSGSTQAGTISSVDGTTGQNVNIIDYTVLTDAVDKYSSEYSQYLDLQTAASTGTYYRNGGLSDFFKYFDYLLTINPTDSNYTYYISPSTTSTTACGKTVTATAKACADDIDNTILSLATAASSASADSGLYDALRDDANYVQMWATQYDSNSNRLYGIGGLMTTYNLGNYTDSETGDVVYTADSWAIFDEAYKVAEAVITYGATNGYTNKYPLSSYTFTYKDACLTNIDSSEYEFENSSYLNSGNYYLYYDSSGDSYISVDEAVKALTLAYKNLKLNYSVVDAELLEALINEANTLIKNSSYFTDTSYTNAGLSSLIATIQTAVWGSTDNFGVDASLLKLTTAHQELVNNYVTQLVEAIENLIINTQKTVGSGGGYSLVTAINYCGTLNQSDYTNWAQLQTVLDEANVYRRAASDSDSTYDSGSTYVTVDSSAASAVSGSAYKYITRYIDLVERLYKAILSLTVKFNAIENGQIASSGELSSATGSDTSDSNKGGYWNLTFNYNSGMIVFRTSSDALLIDLGSTTLVAGSKASYEQLLDSININAAYGQTNGYATNSTSGKQLTNKSDYGDGTSLSYALSTTQRASEYPGQLSFTTGDGAKTGGTFNLGSLFVTAYTGKQDYFGYEAVVDTSSSSDDNRSMINTLDYEWTSALSTTEGAGGSAGVDRDGNTAKYALGGVVFRDTDGSNTRGYTSLSGTYTYYMEAYEQDELSASTTPFAVSENTDRYIGFIYYTKVQQVLAYYYGYHEMSLLYNPNLTVIDVSYLFDLIDIYETLEETHYTTASWAAYEKAYQAAINDMDYGNMTASEILSECQTRYSNLWTAYQALVPIYTLVVKDCNGSTLDVSSEADFQYENDINDTANQVTFVSTSLPYGWYIDDSCTLTVTQGSTLTLTVHTDVETTVTRVSAHCSADGSTTTTQYCNTCNTTVHEDVVVIPATGDHDFTDWYSTVYATDSQTGTIRRDCQNSWTDDATGETVYCEHFEEKTVAQKVRPTLTVDNAEISDNEITFEYPTEVEDNALGENQYYIDFEYTDTFTVLDWSVAFADADGNSLSFVEGTDYVILQGSEYAYSTNDDNKLCLVVFRSERAQAAWDEGRVTINANTAVFTVNISAVDCEGNDVMSDISYTINNSAGDTIATWTKGTATGLTYDSENGTYYFTNMADTYTVTVTDDAGYTLDDTSVIETTSGDRTYDDFNLLYHKSTYEATSTVDPDCTEEGYTIHYRLCSVCRTVCSQEIKDYTDALGHDYQVSDDPTLTYAADCTTDGQITYVCSRCGETYIEIDYATGHKWVEDEDKRVASTCTTAGSATYVCSNCGETKTISLPTVSHQYTATVTAPGCETQGYTTYTCSVCGTSYQGSYTAATGHSYRFAERVEADCKTTGYILYTCKNCVASYTVNDVTRGTEDVLTCTETAADHVHTADCNTTVPTVSLDITLVAKDGETVYNSDGGSYKVEVIDTTSEHSYEITNTKEPTCTEDGYNVYTCSVCGDTYTEVLDPAHTFNEGVVTTAATCTTDGEITYTCTVCGATETEVIPATGHNYTKAESVAATCEEAGYDIYTCENCVGTNYTINEDGTLSDGAGNVLTETVFDEEGNVVTAGEYYTVVTTAALGHSYRLDSTVPATCGAAG